MARILKPVNRKAARRADKEFHKRHPNRKNKPLTKSSDDMKLRAE